MDNDFRKRTSYNKALGWKRTAQKYEFRMEAEAEKFAIFYLLPIIFGGILGGVVTFFIYKDTNPIYLNYAPIAIFAIVGAVVGHIIKNDKRVTDLENIVNKETDALRADVKLSGAKRLTPKQFTKQFPKTAASVRLEQKPLFRRKMDLYKNIDKKGNITYESNSDQYEYFEPSLFQNFGLAISVPKILTKEEQFELKKLEAEYEEMFDEIELEKKYEELTEIVHIKVDDDEKLKEFQIEKIERPDVLFPLAQLNTHMYIQGRAGSGKSVLYSKFYRATLGIPTKTENGILEIKPDLEILKILEKHGLSKEQLTQKQQELIDALKCKNVLIDTKGDVFEKYYRDKFVIKNVDGTETMGQDVMYAGGLDERSIPYDFSADLIDDGKLNKLAVNNFAESIFKTAEITSDSEKFWAVNGKNVVRAAIQAIYDHEGTLNNKLLFEYLKSDKLVDMIQRNKKAKKIAGQAIDGKSDSERVLGILSGITEKAIFLEWVATERESEGTFSFKKWFNDGVPGTLFLVATDELVDILMPLYGIITSFMLESIFTRDEDNPGLNVYWYGDEMPKMGRIAGIEKGLTFGRSKGLRMFPGTQNNKQLEDLYEDKSTSITEGAGNKALFAQGGPESAEFCSKFLGKSRVINKNNGVRMGDSGEEHTHNEARDNNYAEVLDSEFMFMEPTTFIFASEKAGYTKISMNFHKTKKMRSETEKFELTFAEAEEIVENNPFARSSDDADEEFEDFEDIEI